MFIRSILALSCLSGALAGPLRRSNSTVVGSIFVMTNGIDKNGLVSMTVSADGSLNYAGITPTNGVGDHGRTPGLDPIFTQGPVRVHAGLGLACAVNPGSNTLQLFSLDPQNPAILTPFGEPIPSLGDYPSAVDFNQDGSLLCAINNGINANVVCFKILDGGRQVIPGTPRDIDTNQPTSPPNGPGNTIGTVRFTQDQKHIVTTVKGTLGGLSQDPGYLAIWAIDETSEDIVSETFDQTVLPVPAGIEFSLTDIPGRNAFVSGDFEGADVFDLSGGTNNVKVHTLRLPGAIASCWSVYSSKTNTYFISDIGSSNLTEIQLAADLTPSIVRQYPLPGSNINEATVADVAGTQYLYALMTGKTSVGAFRLDGPGNAVLVQTVNFSAPVTTAGFSVDPFQLAGMALYIPS